MIIALLRNKQHQSKELVVASSSPLSVKDFFVPSLGGQQTHEAAPRAITDRADLITKVYTDMGIFRPEAAEQALDVLRSNPLIDQIGSFVVVNLTPEYNLESLMVGYNKGRKPCTTRWSKFWDQYSLAHINRRTVPNKGGIEPDQGEIRVHTQTPPENEWNETGLVGLDNRLEAQRELIANRVLLNLTDYVLLQKLCEEEGIASLDDDAGTITRFPQMGYKSLGGNFVGAASSVLGQVTIDGSLGLADHRVGFRLSDAA